MSSLATFYKTSKTVDQYIAMSRDLDGGEHIEKLKEYLKAGSRILEIGTGPGRDYELLIKDYETVGSDLSEEFITRLQANHPKGDFVKLDASLLETDSTFDAIYSNKVLHHLTDEELYVSIARQGAILHPEGLVCHSFWKGNGIENFDDMFVNNHTEEGLRSFFASAFEILHLSHYKEFEDNDSLFLIARKKS